MEVRQETRLNFFFVFTLKPFAFLFRAYISLTLHSEMSQYYNNNLLISFKFTLNINNIAFRDVPILQQ